MSQKFPILFVIDKSLGLSCNPSLNFHFENSLVINQDWLWFYWLKLPEDKIWFKEVYFAVLTCLTSFQWKSRFFCTKWNIIYMIKQNSFVPRKHITTWKKIVEYQRTLKTFISLSENISRIKGFLLMEHLKSIANSIKCIYSQLAREAYWYHLIYLEIFLEEYKLWEEIEGH